MAGAARERSRPQAQVFVHIRPRTFNSSLCVVHLALVPLRQLQRSAPQAATTKLADATPHASMDNNTSGSAVKKQEEMDVNDSKAVNKDGKPSVRTLNRVPRTMFSTHAALLMLNSRFTGACVSLDSVIVSDVLISSRCRMRVASRK